MHKNETAPPRAKFGRRRPWVPYARRALTFLLLAAVLALIAVQARRIDWAQVAAALRAYRAETLLPAAALAAASYLLYGCYDLLGRAYTRHRLPPRTVLAVGFVGYAFNLNFAWIGAIGLRYRLYSRAGLPAGTIARIFALAVATNWSGYVLLGGALFLWRPLPLPPAWGLDAALLRPLGAAMLASVPLYLLLCAYSPRRSWTVGGARIWLPRARVALLQLLLSGLNWLLIAAVLFVLLRQRVEYAAVAGALLVGAIAGVVVHVPAGLGVLETVFLGLLGHRLPPGEILAALLAYRAIYYLAPLLIAAALYAALEAGSRRA